MSEVLNIVFMSQIGKMPQCYHPDAEGKLQFDLNAIVPADEGDRYEKWGTPGNAKSTQILHDDIVSFQTYEQSPCEVFVELSRSLPGREIAVWVCDGNTGVSPSEFEDDSHACFFGYSDGPVNFYRAGKRVLHGQEWILRTKKTVSQELVAQPEFQTLKRALLAACDRRDCKISYQGPQLSAVKEDSFGRTHLFANYNKYEDIGLVRCQITFDVPAVTFLFDSQTNDWHSQTAQQSCSDQIFYRELCQDFEFVDQLDDLAQLPLMQEVWNINEYDAGANVGRAYAMIHGIPENKVQVHLISSEDEITSSSLL